MDQSQRIEDYLVADIIPHEVRACEDPGEEPKPQELPERKPEHDIEDPEC